MTAYFKKIKHGLNNLLKWKNIKIVLIANGAVTILISIFDFVPDIKLWTLEILRNIVLANCIGFSNYSLITLFGLDNLEKRWNKILSQIIVLAFGGWIGGLSAWYINDILFGFHVTSAFYFSLLISSLSVFLGFVITIFFYIWEKLKETASALAQKELNEQRLLRLKTKAELEALRSKINPHFLFNTINSISGLIHVNPDKADEMLQKLSNLFRYTLDMSRTDFCQLKDEIEIIESYLEIEKVRLADRLSYQIEIDKNLEHVLIPGMLLQPLVENSIKHGISTKKSGGKIRLVCKLKNNKCDIEIIDSGEGFEENVTNNGFGLGAVKDRLKLHYGNRYEFKMTNNHGVNIKIRLPIIN